MGINKFLNKNWELYLSRPFNLFEASIWYAWYISPYAKEIFGLNFKNVLFIESPKGVTRHYREKEVFEKYKQNVKTLASEDIPKIKKYLNAGLKLNEKAKKLLDDKSQMGLRSAVDLVTKLALSAAALPRDAGVFGVNNKTILSIIGKLRAISYYPKLMAEIVVPAAVRELEKMGITDKDAINVVTLGEILGKKRINLESRLGAFGRGERFIYYNAGGKETIAWTKNVAVSKLRNKIEKLGSSKQKIVRGSTAFTGSAKGIVRLVLVNKIGVNERNFAKGNILVAISTSPNLMPIMKNAGAIITDEGGVTSHAAILSRELKIPCIIGTKIATQVLKDGDLVEVDANKGVVKIMKTSSSK